MKQVITIATATIMTLLAAPALSIAGQGADTRDRTIMTFSNAVDLPRMRLEKGTYVFRLADTAGRNVIQVLSQDEKKTLGQWFFVPVNRLEASSETVVTFRETSAAATPAVQYWYYPGEKTGKEFIYSKEQALQIARRTGVTVLTDDGRVSSDGQAATQPVAVSARAEVPAAVSTQSSGVVNSSRVPEAQVAARAEQAPTTGTGSVRQESTTAQNELPGTAGFLPLSGLIAGLTLAAAAGIRRFRIR